MWLLTLVGGCLPDTLPERNCASRVAFYPDADGDGLGEPTDVYIGCEAPPGWTTELAPAHTGDTGESGESGDTGTTGGAATSTGDTGAAGGSGP